MYSSTTSPRSPQGRFERASLSWLLLFTFALRIFALDRLGLAYDESASALMARATPLEIINFHWHAAFEHPPLWVLLLHTWSLLAGQSEFALRYIPAIADVLSVAVLWRITRTLWPTDRLLPLLSALFVATAPVLVYYAQETRMYTLVVLLMLVAILILLRLCMNPTWRHVIGFWLTCWAMLGLHYYAALALAIQATVLGIIGILSLVNHRPTAQKFPWTHLLVAFSGAVLPLLAWMFLSPGFHTTLTVVLEKAGENQVSWQYFLGDLWRELTFGSIRWQPDYATVSYVIAPLVGIGAVISLFQPKQSRITHLGSWLLIAVVLLPILSSTLFLRTLVPRYILWIVPLFYALAALSAVWLWQRHWLAGLAIVLVILSVDIIALQYYFGPYRKSDYRPMTEFLQEHGDPTREILLLEAPRQHLLAKYYVPPTWQVHPMPTLPVPDYWPLTAPLLVPEDEDDRLQGWLAEYEAIWVSYSSEAEVDRGEFLAKYLTAVAYRQACTQWLDVRLCHYVSPHHLTPQPLIIDPLLFGNELALLGGQASFYHSPHSSTSLLVQLDWYTQQQPSVDYKVVLQLVAPDGAIVDEANDYPIGSLLPPTTWGPDEHKPGYVTLHIPTHIQPGEYQLALSLYDANSLAPTTYAILNSSTDTDMPTSQPHTLAVVQIDDTMKRIAPHGQ